MASAALEKAFLTKDMPLTEQQMNVPALRQKITSVSLDNTLSVCRKRTPMVLSKFMLPNYLRREECGILLSDSGNSALEMCVKSMRCCLESPDYLEMFLKRLDYPFFLNIPEKLLNSGIGEEGVTVPEFIVGNMKRDKPDSMFNGHEQTKKGSKRWEMAMTALNGMVVYLQMMCAAFRDPREIAAVALVMFSMFPPFNEHHVNIRAGAFFANAILLAEYRPPLTAEMIQSVVLFEAVEADVAKWRLNTTHDAYAVNTAEAIKLMVHKCYMCGSNDVTECDKCKYAWYCGDDCRALAKEQHKPLCDASTEQALEFAELVKSVKACR